jgi:CHAT domain-containing protein
LDRNELDRAEAAIHRGIAAFEAYRDLPSAEMRIGSSDPSWALFVRAMQVALLRGDAAHAFEYSERRRIQASLELRQWGQDVVSLAELQRKLSADTALLVLNQMDDHLQVWTIRQSEVTTHTVSISAEGASGLVAAHLYEVAAGAPIPHVSGDLFDRLLQPVTPSLTGVRNLVVLPDAPYQRVAFAALWDRTRNRYLVEDRTVVEAPSATAYVWALARGAQVPVDRLRQAVVIDSATVESEHEADVRHRFNDREVATLYPDAEVRRGEAATAKRLMNHRRVRDVIHVAAPLHPNDEYPFLSRLLLADIPGQKHSGAVFARHVLDTELSDARLVTLEPRHERNANAISHDHAALGFSRALLAAGVPNVVGPIAAVGAQKLKQSWLEFHRHYSAGLSAADSLRQAQLTALSESNHRPGPWAMLTVFGSTQ